MNEEALTKNPNVNKLRELLNRAGKTQGVEERERPKQRRITQSLELLFLLAMTGCGPILKPSNESKFQSTIGQEMNTAGVGLGELTGHGSMSEKLIIEIVKSDPATWPVGAKYPVEKGDTLFELAQKFYGPGRDPFVGAKLIEMRNNMRGTLQYDIELLIPDVYPFEVLPEHREPLYALPNISPQPTPTLAPGAP